MTLQGMSEQDYSKLTKDELAKLLRARDERDAAKLSPQFKIGAKGGVSVSGLGQRFPTTLYAASWLVLLSKADELRAFIAAHARELK